MAFLDFLCPKPDADKSSTKKAVVLGIVGDTTSVLLYLSQIPTYYTVVRDGELKGNSPLPCITTILNSFLWGLYATKAVHYNIIVMSVCVFGVLVECCYLIIHIRYSPRSTQVMLAWWLFAILFATGCGMVVLFFRWPEHEERKTPLGIVCVVSGIIMYAAPCWDTLKACKNKKANDIPLLLSIVGFGNCFLWLAYSLVKGDRFIKIQNICGLVFSLGQMMAFTVLYYFHTPGRGFYFLCA